MLSLDKNQLAGLRRLDEDDFVRRMTPQWFSYADDFPLAERRLSQEQVEQLAREAWRVADQHQFDDDLDRIRLTFHLWRAARLSKPLGYLQELARFLVAWLPERPAYAHDWIDRRLHLDEAALEEARP
ncbi:hypothetical protein ACFJIW_02165 [Tahibacter sp. UC22_41]|uniref:hypothetical protein n=1 Tax=Tahibacter sp. UC22_41 TaxID=3350178 RepID=UPI0036DB43DD